MIFGVQAEARAFQSKLPGKQHSKKAQPPGYALCIHIMKTGCSRDRPCHIQLRPGPTTVQQE